MTDCIFCQIVNDEIPSNIVYEDEKVLAFLDLTQVTKGHTLVIPKKHVADIFDLTQEDAADLFSCVPKIVQGITASDASIKGINLLNNNKEAAHQSVFHFHIHIIPRYGKEDDLQLSIGNHMSDYTQKDLEQIASKIRLKMEE